MSQLASLTLIPQDNAALSDEITRLAGHINAAQHRFLTLLAALIERDAWAGGGIKSPAHWLNYYCGIDLGAAREKVRVAKSLQQLPGIDEAFRSGTISYSKVRAMTRSATPDNEQMLLQVALHGTAQHVEQLVRKYRRVEILTDERREQSRYDARELTCYFDDDGMLVLRGRMTPEDGAVFMKAVEAMVAAQNPPVTQDDVSANLPEKTFPQKRVDALLALTEQAMCTMEEGLQPLSSADKYQVVVHIERSNQQNCSFESGAHHVQHWCDGGETRLDNLVLLCRHHHRLLHQEGYGIVKHGEQQFEFLTPAGDAMRAALAPQFAAAAEDVASETLAIEREHDGLGLAIDSRTAVTRWEGEKMDYDLAIGAMLDRRTLGFLYRLSISKHADQFLHRPTRVADFLGFGSAELQIGIGGAINLAHAADAERIGDLVNAKLCAALD